MKLLSLNATLEEVIKNVNKLSMKHGVAPEPAPEPTPEPAPVYVPELPIDNTIRLPIVWVSQLNKGAQAKNNDCGPAAVAEILASFGLLRDTTVDELYAELGIYGDRYTSYSQLVRLLEKRGLPSVFKQSGTIIDIVEDLKLGLPSIFLVDYEFFAEYNPNTTFTGQHFLVVEAFNDDTDIVTLCDPLWRKEEFGGDFKVSLENFDKAWRNHSPVRSRIRIPLSLTKPEKPLAKFMVLQNLNVRRGPGFQYAVEHRFPAWTTNLNIFEYKTVNSVTWGRLGHELWMALDEPGWRYAKELA